MTARRVKSVTGSRKKTKVALPYTYAPMEARLTEVLPEGDQWQYEPKWDGFRCIVFRNGDRIELRSKAGRPLTRYFPELVEVFGALSAQQFVLDGEIVVPDGATLSFDALLQRIHPAASRITKLAAETPAMYIAFDCLADDQGRSLTQETLPSRRAALEQFFRTYINRSAQLKAFLRLSPATEDVRKAKEWLTGRSGLDGVIAKRTDLPYQSGNRDGMQKVKRMRTAECVVGGFRYASKKKIIGSLLLGLYDGGGLLHHVGFTSSFTATQREELLSRVEPLIKPPGFTGQAPGGPSRWSTNRSSDWHPLNPKLVVEVQYDHFSDGRFRHGTKFLRWRPDKPPKKCTIEQVESESRSAVQLLRNRR